jgi:hypothetical protein
MDDSKKYQALSLIQANREPKDIAEELDVSYGGVLKLKRNFKDAVANGTVDQLFDMDRLLLAKVGEEISTVADAETAVTTLTQGLDGLERLSTDFQKTALHISTRVSALIHNTDLLGELEIAAKILCDLQSAFLNKNSIQMNVQNNFGGEGSTPKYSQFLSDDVVQ